MKILHCADLHLGAAFTARSREEGEALRQTLRTVPERLASLCRREGCDLLLLAGDVFDIPNPDRESVDALRSALEEAAVPVFVAPGNHDYICPSSPYVTEAWPGNVAIFSAQKITCMSLPDLNCRIYGAGYTSMDCPPLLEGFSAPEEGGIAIGLLHGDPIQPGSPCCPVTAAQAEHSGLTYLALGHIHQSGAFRAGKTLCAWPGCPMGRGFDETGEKGALVVTLDGKEAQTRFVGLGTAQFHEETVDVQGDPAAALSRMLPGGDSPDYWRITLTGESEGVDTAELIRRFPQVHLQLRDKTVPPEDLWAEAGEDTLQGAYFRILQEAAQSPEVETARRAELAARISRKILSGQEVTLP